MRPIPGRHQHGITLVELMVAMVLGLLVSAAILTAFHATSVNARVQRQLARMQEDGRFALSRLRDDLDMAGAMQCSNTGGVARQTRSGVSLDALRAPRVLARDITSSLPDLTTRWGAASGSNTYPPAPSAPYFLPSFLYMRGYSCRGLAACAPAPVNFLGGKADRAGADIGERVLGSDVLTLRYVDSSRGWNLGSGSRVVSHDDGSLAFVTLKPSNDEPPASTFTGNLALLWGCPGAEILAVSRAGNTIFPQPSSNFAASTLAAERQSGPLRLYDLANGLATVTWYLKVVSDDDTQGGAKTGALVRRLNGGSGASVDEELVRGVERLTFLYGIEDAEGNVRYLTAGQVDSRVDGALPCPPDATGWPANMPGCLWRAVKTIDVSLLMAGQAPVHALTPAEFTFVYTADGSHLPVLPNEPSRKRLSIRPSEQGFADSRMRRQMGTLVMLRNYNP